MKKISLITHHYNAHDKAQVLLDHLANMSAETTAQVEILPIAARGAT